MKIIIIEDTAAIVKSKAIKNNPNFISIYKDIDYLEVTLYIYLFCNKYWLFVTQETVIQSSIFYLKTKITKGHNKAIEELETLLLKKGSFKI
jgi:hypothetical protein